MPPMKALCAAILLCAFATRLLGADSAVVFNEIMYHPLTNESASEWLELQNQMSVDVDISSWRLDGGVDFRFGEGTIVRAGGYLVVALSPEWLTAATGLTNVTGPFTNRLSNAGERIRLRDHNGRIMDEVTYGVEGDWPVAPDGTGPSLARRRANVAGDDSRNWLTSAQIGGTPGLENFRIQPPTIVSNTRVSIEAAWRFNDSGVDLGSDWRNPNYDDSGWASGAALFFHEDAPLPAAKNTPLAPGRVTYYFRSAFEFSGDAATVERIELVLRSVTDDGALGYLNGAEIFRINMPAGAVTYSTLASGQVGDATFGEAILLPVEQLLPGPNILAVEVHQAPTLVSYPQAVLNSAPMGYWRIGETTSPALDSASAPGSPQSGAQNGSYSGFLANLGQDGPRPTDVVNAQALVGFEATNAAPAFAGNTDGGNDVVTILDPGVFNFAATRTFTIEAWVNGAAAQEDGAAIVAKGVGGGGEQFSLDVVGGRYRFYCWDGGVPNTPFITSATVGPNAAWQHVVGVLDQPAGRMKIYVNGVEVGSGVPRPTIINTTHEVSIGARKGGGSPNYDLNFAGRIDEVAIYNRALSPAEVLAHFNAAFTNNPSSGADTNDAVFGLELVAAETLPGPEPPLLAFNELASSTNSLFWLELINYGRTNVALGGCVIARFGGMTNREFALPSQVLAPGQLLQVTKAELGFGADSGDRLVLYAPGRSKVFDAVVAKKDPRGRLPDGTGGWWFPNQPTPGASNSFVLRDELVINEIMFHARELPFEPATFSPTNVLVTITNLWRYRADGLDLGTEWRAPTFDDSAWRMSNSVFYAPTNIFALPAPRNTFMPLTNSEGVRIVTFYFRTRFMFSGDTNNLLLALNPLIDDGAVFYLNGVEVHRLNMPATNILYGTLATLNVGVPAFTGPVFLSLTNLAQGVNTLAVELHQVHPSSPDVFFGTELLAFQQLTPALPFRDSPQSWVEIFNRSSNAVDLTGWRLDEGIDFRFPAGRTIAPGGYLVVAKDPDYLRDLYPALDVLGPFTNRLGRRSDYFVLKDANNNLADEVRYFDDGYWPRYADGGGSSLELRDPHADNMSAEAWAASDEQEQEGGAWQTYTWRGISAPGQTNEPTLWHELALCLVDGAGEVLIDDVSVIETPATAPKQLIYNGSFDGGPAHWRFLGNHRHSRVEAESSNPGNSVLHLVATGPGEYQGNQIETTLTNNIAIVDGREYEVSFRARWLAGKAKLNARLYFNRLARTFDLPVSERNGTPGAVNSRYVGNIGPTFSDLMHSPVVPAAGQRVTISVAANDPDDIASMVLKYSVAGGHWQTTAMSLHSSEPNIFRARIPGQPAGTIVQFYIEATDALGAVSHYPAAGPNSRALYVVQDNQALPGSLSHFRLVMTTADATFLHTGTNALSNELLGGTVIYDEREVFYDVGVRLKGSFVGRNVARVGYHVVFSPHQRFRGLHEVVSVDRSQHTVIGGLGELIVKHIGNHAGGILSMYDDIQRFIAPLPAYTITAQMRLTGFDSDYLDAQFNDGSDGPMFEVEVLRWNLATVDGNPESPKLVGNESGGTGYANLEMRDYGNNKESYRWFLLQVNNRTADDSSKAIAVSKALALTGPSLDVQARQLFDLDEWLRVMAFQELVGTADAYFTGANIHNFRLYVRPDDQKVLYLPWDWDSAFLASATAPIIGTGNIANLLNIQHHRRTYLNHMFEILTTTFNTTYMSRWTTHYGAVGNQDLSAILNYINARAAFALSQLPTATAFAITSNAGNNFATSNSFLSITGSAPISVKSIEINGLPYGVTWINTTTWTLTVPLFSGTNLLAVQGVDNFGNPRTNATDTITITNVGLSALQPVLINEWMADNDGPGGLPDPDEVGAPEFQDWFELFNPNTNAFNLSGYYLADSATQWRVPSNTVIAPRGFLLVWADAEEHQNVPGDDLHAGFRLSVGGEILQILGPDGITVQSEVEFGPQFLNVSQGRFPDGDTNGFHFMTNWTPRAPNLLGLPPAPEVTELTVTLGESVAISFRPVVGRACQVEYKNDLNDAFWEPLGLHRAASADPVTIIDTTDPAARPQRFYRVVLLQ
jgi:hypothetical protein